MPITSTGTGEQPVALFHHICRLREQAIEFLIKGETDKNRNIEDELQVLANEIRELGRRLEAFQILGIYKILQRENDYEFGAPIVLHLVHDETRKLYNLLVSELTKSNKGWKGLDKKEYPRVVPLCAPTPDESLDEVHTLGMKLQSIGWEMNHIPYSEFITAIENNNRQRQFIETNLDESEPSFSINNEINWPLDTHNSIPSISKIVAQRDLVDDEIRHVDTRNELASSQLPVVDLINTNVAQRDLIDKTRQGNETKASERASSRPPVGISTPVAQSDLNKEMSNQQADPISIERVKITSKTITTVSKVENSSMERTKTTTKVAKNNRNEKISQKNNNPNSMEPVKITKKVAQRDLIDEIDQADTVVMEQLRNMNNAEPRRENMEKLGNVLQELGSRFETLLLTQTNNEQPQAGGENLAIVLLKTRKLYQLIGKRLRKHYKGSLHDLGVQMDNTSRQIYRVEVDQIGEKFKTFGREMKEGLSSSQYVNNKSTRPITSYGFIDLLAIIGSILFYLVNVCSDLYLAVQYYYQWEYWYCGLTLTFVMIPIVFIPLLLVEYQWSKFMHRYLDIEDKRSKGWLIFRSSSSLFRYLEALWYGCNSLETMARIQKRERETSDSKPHKQTIDDGDKAIADAFRSASNATFMRYLECFAHAAPQLALQLYIMKVGSFDLRGEYYSTVLIRYVSITTSLICLSWIPTSLYRTLRLNAFNSCSESLADYKSMKKEKSFWRGDLVLFIANFMIIVSRVIAISQFIPLDYTWTIWIICLVHWIGCSVWLYIGNSKSALSVLERLSASFVLGFMYIFNFFGFKIEHSSKENEGRYFVSFSLNDVFLNYKYFTVFFLENTILLVLYILNANGFSAHIFSILTGDFNAVVRVNYWSWYHTFFAASQPLSFFIGFNLLHLYPLFYPSSYKKWLKSAEEQNTNQNNNELNE